MPPSLSAGLVTLLAAGSLAAQTTWTVPNGASVEPTLALASPGDIVQLSGDHPGFAMSKGVTVLGPATIRGNYFQPTYDTAIAIPAGQAARFVDVDFVVALAGLSYYGHIVTVGGDVSFEDCVFSTSSTVAVDVLSGAVHMQRCSVVYLPAGRGVRVRGGYCSIVDSVVMGLAATSPYSQGITMDPAVEQTGGVLQASGVQFTGAFGGVLSTSGSALLVSGGTAFVTDSDLTGGAASFVSLAAPAIQGNGSVYVARTVLSGGTSSGIVTEPLLVGLVGSGGLVRGQPFTATATAGSSQQLLAIIATFGVGITSLPGVVEPVYGAGGPLTVLATTVPAAGAQVTATIQVPNVASLAGVAVWLQAAQLSNAGIRASAVVGGVVR